jgi:hypothetical protein
MTEFQKFPDDELDKLRADLQRSGLDTFQAAELIAAFLSARGYGVSTVDARTAASRIEALGYKLPLLQKELEGLAWVM